MNLNSKLYFERYIVGTGSTPVLINLMNDERFLTKSTAQRYAYADTRFLTNLWCNAARVRTQNF